jgi:hypothetical protein
VIRSWKDLDAFGIIPLTGETCPIARRMQCDLTPAGIDALERFFDVPKLDLHKNLNHAEGQVATILLSKGIFWDLAAWLLIYVGKFGAVLLMDNEKGGAASAIGIRSDCIPEYVEAARDCEAQYTLVRPIQVSA